MAELRGWRALDLRRMLFAFVGGVLVVIILVFAAVAWQQAERVVEPAVERQLSERSSSAVSVIESIVESAITDVELLALSPTAVAVATRGGERARQLGLDDQSIAEAEERMAESGSLAVSQEADHYLRSIVERSVFAEVFITDRHGFVVARSGPTSDFVQRDEEWWLDAYAGRENISDVGFDESTRSISFSVAVPVRNADGVIVGVMKGVLDLGRLKPALSELARGWGYVQVVDERGQLVVDHHDDHLLEAHPDLDALSSAGLIRSDAVGDEPAVGMAERALGGRWTVAYWVPESQAFDLVYAAQRAVVWGVVIALAVAVLGVVIAGYWVSREIGRPVRTMAAAADRVGAGDLRAMVERMGKGEVEKLSVAVQGMIDRLRELVGSLREASHHTQGRSQEIAGAVQQLSSGAQEMTATLSRLTGEAAEQSETIQEVNARMEALGSAARELAVGATTATERSRELREIAAKSRERLREGRAQVDQMAQRSDLATSRLLEFMDASRKFAEFVDLIKGFAHRTNLLALNAAIEAARAGGEARGFGVLADEIRKLANQAGAAANRAQDATDEVLNQLESARLAVDETREATHAIGAVVESVDEGFDAVTQTMGEAESWAERVAQVSGEVDTSLRATAERLNVVAAGYTDFAAAMEELAAGMEEQNASTEEIAAAVNALNTSAWQLSGLADVFILEGQKTPDVEATGTGDEAEERETEEEVVPAAVG